MSKKIVFNTVRDRVAAGKFMDPRFEIQIQQELFYQFSKDKTWAVIVMPLKPKEQDMLFVRQAFEKARNKIPELRNTNFELRLGPLNRLIMDTKHGSWLHRAYLKYVA